MTPHISSWISQKKWILISVGIPVLVAAWWAFRPEKLWINEKVNEPAPFTAGAEAQPLFTGRLEGKAHPTSGRATIYKSPDGKLYLRLTGFMTSNGPDVHVVLARSGDKALEQQIVRGSLDDVRTRAAQRQPGRSELRCARSYGPESVRDCGSLLCALPRDLWAGEAPAFLIRREARLYGFQWFARLRLIAGPAGRFADGSSSSGAHAEFTNR